MFVKPEVVKNIARLRWLKPGLCLAPGLIFQQFFQLLFQAYLPLMGLLVLLCAQPEVLAQAHDTHGDKPTSELIQQLEITQGEERTPLQLALLKRLDAPVELRDRTCDELIERYRDQDRPAILGAAYAGKGKALGDRLDFEAAVKMLEIAERYGRQCEAEDPSIYFKARCNRVAYMNASDAMGKREETVKLLQEAIEYAKPYGDQLDMPFAYAMLGRLAEASGAIDKAFEYLQIAFESAMRQDKVNMAGQAGVSILEIALSEQKYDLAQEWLGRIEPWVEKSSDPRVKFALALRKQDLVRAKGDPQAAAVATEQMIQASVDQADAQSRGLLYLSLAASRFQAAEYPAALEAADHAAEYLKPVFRSWTLAQMTRLECLFAQGESETALSGCVELLQDQRLVAMHRIRLLELKSRILATLKQFEESLKTLQICRDAESQRDSARAQAVAQFIVAAYDGQQREAELKAAKARQQIAESRSKLAQEVALRERTSAANDRFLKYAAIWLSLSVLALGMFVFRIQSNRRAALVIAQREREMNEQLQLRLDKQAADLREETAARQLLELTMERKFRDEALGKLTGGVAHDFNNLLTVIIHSVELIRMQNPDWPTDSRQLLDAISHAADSGSSIVSQLMAYTRQQSLEPKPIVISDWLASVRTMLKQTIGQPILFHENDQSHRASICIDAAQLTTAVINLLANARDAIRPGSGTIELSIHCVTLSGAEPWATLPPGHYAQFQVSDTGKGMSADELQHACEPFFTTKSLGAGTGLGLSTVLGFVKQSGGDLRLASQVGVGTTVSFLVPLTTQPESPSVKPISISATATSCGSLLLVEDQEAVRMVLAAGLKAIGYEVRTAADAQEAIANIQEHGAPAALLSDVRMPGSMNGVQLRRWVLQRHPDVHVVLMSGYRDLEAEGGSDESIVFVQKPVKLQDLRRILQR